MKSMKSTSEYSCAHINVGSIDVVASILIRHFEDHSGVVNCSFSKKWYTRSASGTLLKSYVHTYMEFTNCNES